MINLNSDEFKINHWGILYNYNDDIDNLLIAEKKIIANSETYCKTLIEEFRSKIKNDTELQTKPTSYEEGSIQAQYYGHYYGDTERLINQILQNYRKASLLSIFSVLEGQLKLISKLIEDEFDFSVKIKHITGSDYIHKYWLYLTKVFELDPTDLENEYNLVRQHRYIRNKIAHTNSEIDNNKLVFVKKTKGLSTRKFGNDNIIEIDNDDYVTEIIDLIHSFFNKLINVVDKRYGELKNVG
jgi:hypothetical protein